MSHVVQPLDQPSNYKDSQARMDRNRQQDALSKSTTLYVRPSKLGFSLDPVLTLALNADWQPKFLHHRRANLRNLLEMRVYRGGWRDQAYHYGSGSEYTVCTFNGSIFCSGIDGSDRTPCGFCFVEYYTHAEALACMRYISGTKLDERIVRCDLDLGYKEGRQFGRGKTGGQVSMHAPPSSPGAALNNVSPRSATNIDKITTLAEAAGERRYRGRR